MKNLIGKSMAAALIVALVTATTGAGIKADDVNIGVDPGTNQLVILWSGEEVELPEINGPLFGFGLDEPGFFTIEDNVGDLVPPDVGANLVLEVIAFDDALKGWRPGFAGFFDDPGETWDIGPVPFDEHPFWHIDSMDNGYVSPPGQTEWNATFRILDTGSTGYLASEAVTVTFLPEPSGLVLLAIGGALAMRRDRRR